MPGNASTEVASASSNIDVSSKQESQHSSRGRVRIRHPRDEDRQKRSSRSFLVQPRLDRLFEGEINSREVVWLDPEGETMTGLSAETERVEPVPRL